MVPIAMRSLSSRHHTCALAEELVFEASLSFSCTRPQAWKLSACIPVPWLYSIYRPIADEAALPSCSLLIA